MSENSNKIKVGDYIILQRQKYNKLFKFGNLDSVTTLGKDQIQLRNIDGHKYCTTFKMIPQIFKGKQRLNSLEICNESDMRNIREVLCISQSGVDNRNICDDGESQNLKQNEIFKLREECLDSSKLIEKIVENSKTFNSKTEYSQEKYLKKKEKKYFEYVQIRQPTIRLLTEIFYRQEPEKIMGIRVDTLSQIISYSGVNAFGNYLLYESGSNGLLPAAFLNSMGAGTDAQLVHMHPGNVPQKQSIMALNLPEEQINRCISVNIYSALRHFYQETSQVIECETNDHDVAENPCKKAKLELNSSDDTNDKDECPKWQIENKKACTLMKEKFDSLVIASKEHPSNIIKALLPLLKPSRPIVIYNLSKEILMDTYVDLKSTTEVTKVHLTSNWLRFYQILPNRTHPEVNMTGNSGYLLCGYAIR